MKNTKKRLPFAGKLKRMAALSLAVFLLLLSAFPAFADDEDATFVYDLALMLSDGEYLSLNTAAAEISEESGVGVYVVTLDDYTEYASYSGQDCYSATGDIYYANDFGLGGDNSGILFLISMEDRDYAIFTHGQAEDIFSDSVLAGIEENLLAHLRNSDWYGGFAGFVLDAADVLSVDVDVEGAYSDFKSYDEDNDWAGNYSSDAVTEQRRSSAGRVIIGAVLGAIGGIVTSVATNSAARKNMKSVSEATTAARYEEPGSLKLTVSSETFSHSDVARVLAAAAVGAAAGAAAVSASNKNKRRGGGSGGGPKVSHGGSLSRGSGGFSGGSHSHGSFGGGGHMGGGGFHGGGGRGGKF